MSKPSTLIADNYVEVRSWKGLRSANCVTERGGNHVYVLRYMDDIDSTPLAWAIHRVDSNGGFEGITYYAVARCKSGTVVVGYDEVDEGTFTLRQYDSEKMPAPVLNLFSDDKWQPGVLDSLPRVGEAINFVTDPGMHAEVHHGTQPFDYELRSLYISVLCDNYTAEKEQAVVADGGRRFTRGEDGEEYVTWFKAEEWDELLSTLDALHKNRVPYVVDIGRDPDEAL